MESSSEVSLLKTATILRIKRKRTADPHEALVVGIKRQRNEGEGSEDTGISPLLYSLAGTSKTPVFDAIKGLPPNVNILDFDPTKAVEQCKDVPMLDEDPKTAGSVPVKDISSETDQYLTSFCEAVGEGGTPLDQRSPEQSQITVNGVPMQSIKTENLPEVDYVFDFYWNPAAVVCNPQDLEIRLANQQDIELYAEDDAASSEIPDDEDDSNDESNWRNDYPEEEDHSEDSNSESDSDCGELKDRLGECGLDDLDDEEY